ncbi:hypothetical protein SBD_2208 [Streptomyces bottropensis ATCC 25435]|uniref:Uncharacterized protein n=1 Tax=Streptomyces bottropensis ATCC 25435 TaxID=1054862 RepID=M3DI51_9ACTN|nr:hypothetical protein SBD_2208 [Streptomyces bottropensis ATCC 25435]
MTPQRSDTASTCERVLRLLGRAHLRHTQLLEKIIDARPALLRSQADQRFRPPPRPSAASGNVRPAVAQRSVAASGGIGRPE